MIPHGTNTAYVNHKCRCKQCKKARHDYLAEMHLPEPERRAVRQLRQVNRVITEQVRREERAQIHTEQELALAQRRTNIDNFSDPQLRPHMTPQRLQDINKRVQQFWLARSKQHQRAVQDGEKVLQLLKEELDGK